MLSFQFNSPGSRQALPTRNALEIKLGRQNAFIFYDKGPSYMVAAADWTGATRMPNNLLVHAIYNTSLKFRAKNKNPGKYRASWVCRGTFRRDSRTGSVFETLYLRDNSRVLSTKASDIKNVTPEVSPLPLLSVIQSSLRDPTL